MATSSPPRLERTAFRTSRLLDFVGERELVAQAGHEVEDWPLVAFKEIADNSIDAAEEHDIAPVIEINVSTERNEIIVADNGPGIPVKTIKDVLDFNSRVSSREAYVSPTRGAQGNALKVIVCMPYALADGHREQRGKTIIETRGTAHCITFAVDPVRQTPRISHETAPSIVKKGTRITVCWPATASDIIADAQVRFLQIARTFGAFNPHLALSLFWDNQLLIKISPTNPGWQKWSGSDPTSPHWYDVARLERLMAAYVADDLDHKRERTAREFVSEFRGLSGSVKPATALDAAGLGRPSLADFFPGRGTVDRAAIAGLLAAMKVTSKPVAPEQLGIIGRDHLEAHLVPHGATPENFRYKRTTGERAGIPYCGRGRVRVVSRGRAFPARADRCQLVGRNQSAVPVRLAHAGTALERAVDLPLVADRSRAALRLPASRIH
jgi:Histidine kinase-, DNA gyrase B-, and HSP90-like ATPase